MKPMELTLRISLILGTLLYLAVIFFLLKKEKLSVRYSIIWLASGGVLLLFAVFPYTVLVLGDILRVINPVNFVFMMVLVFILLIILSHSSAVSVLEGKNKQLTQKTALLEERVRRLEAALAKEETKPTER